MYKDEIYDVKGWEWTYRAAAFLYATEAKLIQNRLLQT